MYLYAEFLPLISAAALHSISFWLEKIIKDRDLGMRHEQSNSRYPASPEPAPHYPSAEHIFLCQHRHYILDNTQTHKLNLLGTSVQTPDLLPENLFVWELIWGCQEKGLNPNLHLTLNTVV